MGNNGYNSTTNGVGKYSNLQKNQVYKNKDVFGKQNPWKKDSIYTKNDPRNQEDNKQRPKYKRFSDLKILNEKMMHMSNNTVADNSRIEILTQGEKGEIKNILSSRILKISFVPALASLLLGLIIILTDSYLFTIFSVLIFFGILARTFFYPATLYYENIRYKTTLPARTFFEEMDYWYKISVVKIYIYLILVSIIMFVVSFYESQIIELAINISTDATILASDLTKNYLETLSFSVSLKILAILNLILLVFYSKFANKKKGLAETELKEKIKKIKNESLSRVEQIQEDKE